MSEMKHTPGKWEVRRGGELMPDFERLIVSDLGSSDHDPRIGAIRTIAHVLDYAGPEQTLANAKLIAAAPDLLEACQCMADWIEEFAQKPNEISELINAREVIVKVTA